MKIIAIENTIFDVQKNATPRFAYYPDTSIIRNNDDFYIPNFSSEIHLSAGVYLKICKVGKCIEPKFAYRYFSHIGLAINFTANQAELAIEKGFDGSFATSNHSVSISECQISDLYFKFYINNTAYEYSLQQVDYVIHHTLSEASSYFTFKIGDMFYIPLEVFKAPVTKNTVFSSSINDETLLHFTVL